MKRLVLVMSTLVLFAANARAEAPANCRTAASDTLVTTLLQQAPGLDANVLRLALNAAGCATQKGLVKRSELLTVIDYSMPSNTPRLFTFNLPQRKLVFRELVAHGKNSGDVLTKFFSNKRDSRATSIGLFVTATPYMGSNGYSLRLRGLDKGFNDNAWDRAIVMHGASYVSRTVARAVGRIGRSWGCPAVRPEIARKMIDTLKGGTPVFAYYPDKTWLQRSPYLVASR